jgi:hypothetical protein
MGQSQRAHTTFLMGKKKAPPRTGKKSAEDEEDWESILDAEIEKNNAEIERNNVEFERKNAENQANLVLSMHKHPFENEYHRKMMEWGTDGWVPDRWVYKSAFKVGMEFKKGFKSKILYFCKDTSPWEDLRNIPAKRNPCANRCDKEGSKKCSTCRGVTTAVYCSAECQKVHWKEHKLSCVNGGKEEGRNPCANRCGKEGRAQPGGGEGRPAVYCSAECQQVHWAEHAKHRSMLCGSDGQNLDRTRLSALLQQAQAEQHAAASLT